MKKIKILYWVFTVLFAAGMLFSAIPNEDSVKFISGYLHYPEYMVTFLAVAKFLGVIVILVPGFPRLKEWAYAGLIFDLVGAVYSLFSVGASVIDMWPMSIYFILFAGSYIYYHKMLKLSATNIAVA